MGLPTLEEIVQRFEANGRQPLDLGPADEAVHTDVLQLSLQLATKDLVIGPASDGHLWVATLPLRVALSRAVTAFAKTRPAPQSTLLMTALGKMAASAYLNPENALGALLEGGGHIAIEVEVEDEVYVVIYSRHLSDPIPHALVMTPQEHTGLINDGTLVPVTRQ